MEKTSHNKREVSFMHNKNFDFVSTNKENKKSNYNRYIIFSIVITLLALIISIIGMNVKNKIKASHTSTDVNQNATDYYTLKQESSQEVDIENESLSSPKEKKDIYTITIYMEKISVFKNNETFPFIVSDASVNLLTSEDLRMLEQGIQTSDYNEVRYFLEDFE